MNIAIWSSFLYFQELQTEKKTFRRKSVPQTLLTGDSNQEGKDLSFPACAVDLQSVTWYQKFIWVTEKNPQLKLQLDDSSAAVPFSLRNYKKNNRGSAINLLYILCLICNFVRVPRNVFCSVQKWSQSSVEVQVCTEGRGVLREVINLSQPLTLATHIKTAGRPPLSHFLSLSTHFSFLWLKITPASPSTAEKSR